MGQLSRIQKEETIMKLRFLIEFMYTNECNSGDVHFFKEFLKDIILGLNAEKVVHEFSETSL